MDRYIVLTLSLALHAEGIYFTNYKVKLLCDFANVRYVFVRWLSYITLNINNLTHLMGGVKIVIRSQWFQDNQLVLKILVGKRFKGWFSRPPLLVYSIVIRHLALVYMPCSLQRVFNSWCSRLNFLMMDEVYFYIENDHASVELLGDSHKI